MSMNRNQSNKKFQISLQMVICILVFAILLLAAIFCCVRMFSAPKQIDVSIAENEAETQTETAEEIMASAAQPVELTLSFAGDCTLGMDQSMNYGVSVNSYYDLYGPSYFFENVFPIFEADDLTIVNFEGTLTDSEDRNYETYAFKGDPSYTSILTEGSVEAANLANNHSHDYGEQGFTDTKNALADAGIVTFGYDETAIVEVKNVKIGLVGIYELQDHLERAQQLKTDIAKVKKEGAQLIVVEFHWGVEKETAPDSNQITLGHLAIEEGADIVVGSHPHVIQPIEKYKGRYIVYSLANFCFGGNSTPSDMQTFIFQQTFTVTGNEVTKNDDITIIPCQVSSEAGYNNYQPTPVKGEEADQILARVTAPLDE